MNRDRFDAVTRQFGGVASRRSVIAKILGVSVLAGVQSWLDGAAKKKKKKKCKGGLTTCKLSKKKILCVNSLVDPAHCGGCFRACGGGETCIDGACSPTTCPDNRTRCGGACVNTLTNANHCGGCNDLCPAGEGCGLGICSAVPAEALWGADVLHEPRGIAVDGHGTVYVSSGAPDHQIFLFDTDGNPLGALGEAGGGDGENRFLNPLGLAVDAEDNLYVADSGNNKIKKYNDQLVFQESWSEFAFAFDRPEGVTVNQDGAIIVANSGKNRIEVLEPDGDISWAVKTGPWSITADDDVGVFSGGFKSITSGMFEGELQMLSGWWYPDFRHADFTGVAADNRGALFAVDNYNKAILRFQIQVHQTVRSLEFVSTIGEAGTDAGQFSSPYAIAIDRDGYFYVTDVRTNTVLKLAPPCSGTSCSGDERCPDRQARCGGGCVDIRTDPNHCGGCGDACGPDETCSRGACEAYEAVAKWGRRGSGESEFIVPLGAALDRDGFLYVADSGNRRIQKFTNAGEFVTEWPVGPIGDLVVYPYGVAIDSENTVIVSIYSHHAIMKFSNTGDLLETWRIPGNDPGELNSPRGVAVDSDDNIYVASTGNATIQKLSKTGTYITHWNTAAIGIAIDAADSVFVVAGPFWEAESTSTIKKFNNSGNLLTQWTTSGATPVVTVDGGGDVYVANVTRHRVEKFSNSGAFLTQWGSSGNGDGQFRDLSGIAVDGDGNVFVNDGYKNRVQKFTPVEGAARSRAVKAQSTSNSSHEAAGKNVARPRSRSNEPRGSKTTRGRDHEAPRNRGRGIKDAQRRDPNGKGKTRPRSRS